jgi:hypothetical protein
MTSATHETQVVSVPFAWARELESSAEEFAFRQPRRNPAEDAVEVGGLDPDDLAAATVGRQLTAGGHRNYDPV